MNFGEMVTDLAFRLNYNPSQVSQSFLTDKLKSALNYAYRRELNKAALNAGYRWFKLTQDVTWPANQATLTLPDGLDQKSIIAVFDLSQGEPGSSFVVLNREQDGGDAWWLNYNTLHWRHITGPDFKRTLKFEYEAVAETLSADEDEPLYIPTQFHDLIVISAEHWLRTKADEEAPRSLQQELAEWRTEFWKFLSKGRPYTNPNIIGTPSNYEEEWYP